MIGQGLADGIGGMGWRVSPILATIVRFWVLAKGFVRTWSAGKIPFRRLYDKYYFAWHGMFNSLIDCLEGPFNQILNRDLFLLLKVFLEIQADLTLMPSITIMHTTAKLEK